MSDELLGLKNDRIGEVLVAVEQEKSGRMEKKEKKTLWNKKKTVTLRPKCRDNGHRMYFQP